MSISVLGIIPYAGMIIIMPIMKIVAACKVDRGRAHVSHD